MRTDGSRSRDAKHKTSGTAASPIDVVSDLIRDAKNMIAISGFLISGDEITDSIVKQAKCNVRSYVMVATEEARAEHGGFARSELEECTSSIDKLLMHSMVYRTDYCVNAVVTDPFNGPRGMLFPVALTESKLERNGELAVDLDEAEARELAEMLKWAFWRCTMRETVAPGEQQEHDGPEVVSRPHTTKILQSSPDTRSLEDGLNDLLLEVPDTVIATSRKWSSDHPAVARLSELAAGRTDVTVIVKSSERAGGAAGLLRDAGAKVFNYDWLEVEAVFTDAAGIVMSSPFGPGSGRGMEVGIRVDGRRHESLREVLGNWARG